MWREYGLQEAEKASYQGKEKSFTVSAWRLVDPTAAQAAWQMIRPAAAKPSKLAKLAAIEGNSLLVAVGNYLLQFEGFVPEEETLNQLILHMPRYDSASLPALTGFLPAGGRVPNSERYILGPSSLAAFEPSISPSVAAFHFGTEGQQARYRDQDGEVRLTIFSYPNHQVARDRVAAFEQLTGVTAKRSGPLVAVASQAPNPDAAERVLSMVRYEANVTLDQKMPDPKQENLGDLIVNIAWMVGLLILFCVLAGFGFAAFRILTDRLQGQRKGEEGAMISLHLEEPTREQ